MPHLKGKGNLQKGHYLFDQDNLKGYKIIDTKGDGPEYGVKPVYPDEEDTIVVVNVDKNCSHCLSPHQFGQFKRHLPGGTGFKKQGRKFKKNHLRQIESRLYARGQITFEDYVDGIEESLANSIDEAAKLVARALSDVVDDNKLSEFFSKNDSDLIEGLKEVLRVYGENASIFGTCEDATDAEVTRRLRNTVKEEYRFDVDQSDLKAITQWAQQNLEDVWCPLN